MKYKAIIETDEFKDFEFYEDGIGKFMVGKDAGATADGGWIPLYFTECEQEDILDKIRAEIEEMYYIDECLSFDPQISREDVLKIIDKYKEESEI